MSVLHDTPIGWVSLEGNELTIGSKIDDPPKIRLAAPCTPHGGGGGVVSFNVARNMGQVCEGSQQVEIGYLRVEQSDSVRGQEGNPRGEMNFFLSDGSSEADAAMVRAFAVECDRITKMHPGLRESLRRWLLEPDDVIPASAETRPPFRMLSADGNIELILQNADAINFVIYDLRRPEGDRAIWSASTGWIHRPWP